VWQLRVKCVCCARPSSHPGGLSHIFSPIIKISFSSIKFSEHKRRKPSKGKTPNQNTASSKSERRLVRVSGAGWRQARAKGRAKESHKARTLPCSPYCVLVISEEATQTVLEGMSE